ncbi:MAG: tetratricopeptide repeat protein [Candidatus Kariarchaeaceae archaeon]|jgi:tetratricopeptide (TPR) repeat protein
MDDRFSHLEFDEKKYKDRTVRGESIRDASYFYKEAIKYWLAGDFEIALRNYSRVLEKDNMFFEAWVGQVLMLIELGEYREAAVWSDKARELFPEHPELLALKAVAFLRDAKGKQAIAYSDNSMTKENITPRVWLARAEVYLNRKRSVSEGCIRKAVGASGNNSPLIKLEAARLLRKKGNRSLAIQYLNDVVQALPNSALAWYELGCCQAELGLKTAEMTLQQSLKLRPKWHCAERALHKFCHRGFFRKLFRN